MERAPLEGFRCYVDVERPGFAGDVARVDKTHFASRAWVRTTARVEPIIVCNS